MAVMAVPPPSVAGRSPSLVGHLAELLKQFPVGEGVDSSRFAETSFPLRHRQLTDAELIADFPKTDPECYADGATLGRRR